MLKVGACILLKESDIGHNIFAEREYPCQF